MEKFNLELMSMGDEQFITYRPANNDTIINYQLQMLTNNSISGVLSLSRRQNNEDIALMYNITGMQTLKDYMEKKNNKLTKSEFIKLISSMLKVFSDIYPYQLPSGGILVDTEKIYIKDNEFTPYYIYIPVYNNDKNINELKSFFMGFIVNANIAETNDNFIQRFIDLMNSNDLSIKKIKDFIRQRDTRDKNVKNIVMPPRDKSEKQREAIVHRENSDIQEKGNVKIPQNISLPTPRQTTQKQEIREEVIDVNKENKATGNGNGALKKIVFAAMAVAVVLLIAFLYMNNIFVVEGQLKVEYIGAALLAGAAVLFIVYREMFINNKDKGANGEKTSKNSVVKSNSNKKTSKPIPPKPIPGKPIPPKPMPENQPPKKQNYSNNIPSKKANESSNSLNGSDNMYQMDDDADTEVIGSDNGEVYLEMYDNGSSMRFYIGSHPILIGKQRSRVDYAIANNRVSKVHAEFGYKDGSYYVRDNYSTNGTYINNGARITPQSEVQIVSGDTIRLADVELIFKTM